MLTEIDLDGDFDPNEPGENDPTPVLFPTAIQGFLCSDVDGDDACTEADQPLVGWTVNVIPVSASNGDAVS